MTQVSRPTAVVTARGAATRERILVEASQLFAVRSYFGTPTRDIADAVGLRQPSLFFHFPTKQAIAEELLFYSLTEPTHVAQQLLSVRASAATRLYRYVWFDTRHLLQSPYDLTGVHGDDLMNAPEFGRWKRKVHLLRRHIQTMVQQGQEDLSLLELDPVLTQELLSGINLNTIRMAHSRRRASRANRTDVPRFVADFTLRAILRDADRLPQVADEALALDL